MLIHDNRNFVFVHGGKSFAVIETVFTHSKTFVLAVDSIELGLPVETSEHVVH